jgi:hypothetical protein
MEILDRNISGILKTQNWNQTPKEISKYCECLTTILEMMGQGKNIQPYIPIIIENCLIPGAVRSIRKVAYLIIKFAATTYELPWSNIGTSISQDLGTPSDTEFQIYALRMLYILPLDETISIFSAYESFITNAIKGKNGETAQIGFLSSLPGVLIRIWCGLGHESLHLQDAIREIFKDILNLLTDSDDQLCLLAFEALGTLFLEYEEGSIRGLSHELEANGSDSELLLPLIDYLCLNHLNNLPLIIYRANAINFRQRIKIIYPLTKLICISSNTQELRRLENECLIPMLYNLEKGIIWQVSRCLTLLEPETSTLWVMCNQLLDQSTSETNPTPLLLLVTAGLSKLPISLQLSISLETLRHSNRISSRVDRLSVILCCLSSIVNLSELLLQSKESSAIYQLFSQTWFVEMWMQGKHSEFREEILCCLVECCLNNYKSSEVWLIVGLEVIDVCFKVLDWPCDQKNIICSNYFFLLLEEVCTNSKDSLLSDRVQQTLENLVNRFGEVSIQHQYSYSYAMLVCSKYWLPLTEPSLNKFIDLVRVKLFSTELCSVDDNISTQCLQFLFCSCMHLARRFALQAGKKMYETLNEYSEITERSQNEQENIRRIIGYIEAYSENKDNVESEFTGYFSMFLEKVHKESDQTTDFFYSCIHAALNIFQRKRNECFQTLRPMELLRIAQPQKELNWRCLPVKEITGICDPLRAFCCHVIYPQ